MASFLADYSKFYGDNSLNEDGLNLDDFLLKYDPSEYRNPSVTADVMVFRYYKELQSVEDDLSILMIKRKNHPCIGYWALPGGFVEMREDLETAAKRELEEETGLSDVPVQQVNTFGEVWRDPRNRLITTSFIAYINNNKAKKVKAGDDAAEAEWFDIKFDVKGESIVVVDDKFIERKLYNIELTGPNSVKCSAVVKEDINIKNIIRKRDLSVVESNNIAFDHARFIVDGLLYLENSRKK